MPSQPIRRVHLVFKTHLDVGFTDLAANVIARYLDDYIPRALALAKSLREAGADRFVWTTGSWLVWHALEKCRGARRRALEAGIAEGDIRWHALPFTTHTELMDEGLFRRGLGIFRELDRRFGCRTIAAKMTDVPGHTRAMVPLLAEAGVRMLHLGVNPVCRVPAVPPLFRWRSEGAEVAVVYNAVYGDVAEAPGGEAALAFGFTGDNHGPPAPEQVAANYREVRERFPGAQVAAASLDDFAAELDRVPNLPVVTSEIGDTWIHGAASDPAKLAGFRALQALHGQLRRGIWTQAWGRRIEAFGRALLLLPEHTWGLDIKSHLGRLWDGPAAVAADRRRYRPADFRAALRTPSYRRCVASWQEQRDYLDAAVRVLGHGRPGRLARELLDEALHPPRWSDTGLRPVPGGRARSVRWEVAVDLVSGAITGLTDLARGRRWADARHPLARFRHQTFAWADYQRWLREYTRDLALHRAWAIPDLTKPGMDVVAARSCFSGPRRVRVRQCVRPGGLRLVVDLTMPAAAVARGCPREVRLDLDLPDTDDQPLELALAWRGKDPTRLPEASWLDVHPRGVEPATWRLVKMGVRIDPCDVVAGGGRFLHAVEAVEAGDFTLVPLDAALVAPGGPRLLRADDASPDLGRGISVNLHNNVWGSNFPMWYGEDARFRFRFELG
jgi:hypothetical protein